VAIHPEYRTCSQCDHQNEPDATICANCGSSLIGPTTIAAPSIAAIEVLQPLIQPPTLSIGEVMFLIAGKKDPVSIQVSPDKNQLILGRRSEGAVPPDLDLAEYGGAAGSVSRRHAAVRFSGDRPSIVDLGSTNGTWLNENRLAAYQPHPLRTGDLIRLGQQFVFIYFPTARAPLDIVILTYRGESASIQRLTPYVLIYYLGGYLVALEEMQKIVNQILGQPFTEVTIDEINVTESPATTQLRLSGAAGAIRLVLDKIGPWRKQHAESLREFWLAEQAAEVGDDPAAALQAALEDDLTALSQSILEQFASALGEGERDKYTRQLMPSVCTLARHTFELASSRLR
jgi:hypothetical protein